MGKLQRLRADVDALARADESTVLASLPQWDSLAMLLVLAHAEHVHNRELTGAQLRACRTVGDLLDLLS